MTTSTKEFNSNFKKLTNLLELQRNERYQGTQESYDKISKEVKDIKDSFFKKLDTVSVKYMVGYRFYYENVIKVGAYYYTILHDSIQKMTASNGYRICKEIEIITDSMKNEMIEDSHY